ncbi:MAG: class I SAM-dependent methyltransferase, partial [Pseudomonadota bacterium]
VLDLTCGTGSQVFFLTKFGFIVTGADFSPKLLDIARAKAKKEKLDINFIDGDMRILKVGKFDAVITIFNAIGHLTIDDFENAIRNIYNNLKPGGIYVFDIFNLEAMNDDVVKNLAMDINKDVGSTRIHNIQHSVINRETGQLTSYDSYTIYDGNNQTREIKNEFTLQIYSSAQLQDLLAKNGFENVEQIAFDGSEFLNKKSLSILTIARKKERLTS